MKIIAIIPARMASSRFPGKPLKKIHNIPMIGHCFIRSSMSKLITDCYVATPDKSIHEYIHSIGGKSVMTSHKHKMCHDRVVEAVRKLEKKNNVKYEIILNIQGDLPMVYPDMVDKLIKPLISNKNIQTTTMADEITNNKDFLDPNRVKIVIDKNNDLLFVSREPIPSTKKSKNNFKKFKHVAIRAYKRNFFEKISKLKLTPIEKIEAIDELRVLENGFKIRTVFTKKVTETVDTQRDLNKVVKMMLKDKLLKKYKKNF
tara:strand:+ start:1013 stop:1789 length:777 start_codon:yes stop_codon:yes gene_type:complete